MAELWFRIKDFSNLLFHKFAKKYWKWGSKVSTKFHRRISNRSKLSETFHMDGDF